MSSASRRSAILAALLFTAAFAAAAPSGCAKEVPCQLNSDCVVGYCLDGICQKNCVDATRDCPPGYTCNLNAQCVPGDTTSSAGGGPTTSSTGMGASGPSTTSTGMSGPTTSTGMSGPTTSSTGSGPATGHELDLCGSDGDCVSPLLCRAMVPGGTKRCTRTCSSNAGCMAGTRCENIGGLQYCAGDDAGRPCTQATQCNFGCLGNPGTNQYCTAACNTGADCPNGYGCMAIGSTRVCVKAEEPCGAATDCVSACDVSAQMVVGGCTLQCASASDCPQRAQGLPPWSCDSSGFCKRPSDVSGPLQTGTYPAQYACNAQSQVVNVCNDNLHIDLVSGNVPPPPAVSCNATMTTDGVPNTDTCIDSCRYQGGCPFGSACVAIGSLANGTIRIGLCMPTGGGEVGAPCGHDYDCVFGYCYNGVCSRDCTKDDVCPGGTTCVAGSPPAVEGLPFKRCQ
jgi:hypothetical protein